MLTQKKWKCMKSAIAIVTLLGGMDGALQLGTARRVGHETQRGVSARRSPGQRILGGRNYGDQARHLSNELLDQNKILRGILFPRNEEEVRGDDPWRIQDSIFRNDSFSGRRSILTRNAGISAEAFGVPTQSEHLPSESPYYVSDPHLQYALPVYLGEAPIAVSPAAATQVPGKESFFHANQSGPSTVSHSSANFEAPLNPHLVPRGNGEMLFLEPVAYPIPLNRYETPIDAASGNLYAWRAEQPFDPLTGETVGAQFPVYQVPEAQHSTVANAGAVDLYDEKNSPMSSGVMAYVLSNRRKARAQRRAKSLERAAQL